MPLIKHLPGKSFKPKTTKALYWYVLLASGSTKRVSGITYQTPDLYLVLTKADWKLQQATPVRASWVSRSEYVDEPEKWSGDSVRTKFYWVFEEKLYETVDPDLTPEDVSALVNEAANRRRLQLEKARSLQAMTASLDDKSKRQAIPQDVKVAVWQRDNGRCVECGSQENLEFDHVIPHSMGGADTFRNLQILCEPCNRRKGASLG